MRMNLRLVSFFAVSALCAGFAPTSNGEVARHIGGSLRRSTLDCHFGGGGQADVARGRDSRVAAVPSRLHASADDSGNEHDQEFQQLKISFVTGNEMKRREVNTILNSCGATKGPTPDTSLVDLRLLNVDLPEIQEINTEAIAKNKAIQAAQLANGPCVVEDTSLAFNALGGMPGPFVKFFQDRLKSEGLYRILQDYEDKSAEAVCTLAFCPAPHADPVIFTGRTKGTIIAPVEGRGFGWDSIFVPDEGNGDPFSCMTTEEKCALSHRGKAVRQWADWLGKNREALFLRQEGQHSIGHKGLDFKATFPEE